MKHPKTRDIAWLKMLANDPETHPRYKAAATRILAALKAYKSEIVRLRKTSNPEVVPPED